MALLALLLFVSILGLGYSPHKLKPVAEKITTMVKVTNALRPPPPPLKLISSCRYISFHDNAPTEISFSVTTKAKVYLSVRDVDTKLVAIWVGSDRTIIVRESETDIYLLPPGTTKFSAYTENIERNKGITHAIFAVSYKEDMLAKFELRVEYAPIIFTPNTFETKHVIVGGWQGSQHQNWDATPFYKALKVHAEDQALLLERAPGNQFQQDRAEFGLVPQCEGELHVMKPVWLALPSLKEGLEANFLGTARFYRIGSCPSRTYSDQGQMAGGNVEVIPPFKTNRVGWILLGTDKTTLDLPSDPQTGFPKQAAEVSLPPVECAQFFRHQRQPLIELYSTWLHVGHVDEFMSIIPTSAGKFKIFWTSPAKARQILLANPTANLFSEPEDSREVLAWTEGEAFFTGTVQRNIKASELLEDPHYHFLAEGQPKKKMQMRDFWEINANVDRIIAYNKGIVKAAMELSEEEAGAMFVDIPQLFHRRDQHMFTPITGVESYFPNMVNLLAVTASDSTFKAFVPDSFTPIFNGAIKAAIEAVGGEAHFVNDMDFHKQDGETHCGSNQDRIIPSRVAEKFGLFPDPI